MTVVRTPVEERFWPKVNFDAPNGCWEWTGQRDKNGYGRFRMCTEKQGSAHRVAFALWNGYFPPDVTDHLCSNPPCVRPVHLEAVTPRVNVLRSRGPAARNAAKTHCKSGHPLSGDNLYLKSAQGGVQRICRACHAAAQRERYAKSDVVRGDNPTVLNAAKTHCKNGHPLSGDNLRIRPRAGRPERVSRRCRICHNAAAVKRRDRMA